MEVIVYDLKGSQVAVLAGNYQSSGWHEITWDASGYSSGVYFMRFSSENMVITQKLFLLK
ncbi:MAG: T9SS type A sorting domain-containing protein [FCB group bacterium]|nr:T9SS type A sorting domain-containing protein [FCB group bacterium]